MASTISVGLVVLLVSAATAIGASSIFGIDKQTTISMASLGYLVVAGSGCVAALSTIFSNRQDNLYWSESKNAPTGVWRSSPKLFVKKIAHGVGTGLAISLLMFYLIWISIPYMPGSVETIGGRITRLDTPRGGGQPCRLTATVGFKNRETLSICLVSGLIVTTQLTSYDFVAGDEVMATIVHSKMGDAVVALTKASER